MEKKHIILCDNMFSGKKNIDLSYIPNVTIKRNGSIEMHYDYHQYTNFCIDIVNPDKTIFIGFENYTCLQNGKSIFNDFVENSEILIKKWKNWDCYHRYTESQYKTLNEIIKELCSIYNIEKTVVKNNEYTENDYGVMCRSNFDKYAYDVNPDFNFTRVEI